MSEGNSNEEWKQKTEDLISSFTGSCSKRGKCPGSSKEINKAKKLIEELRVESLKNEELKKVLDDIQARIKASKKLRYIGSIWIPLLVGAFLIFFLYHMGIKMYLYDLDLGDNMESVEKYHQSDIKSSNDDVKNDKKNIQRVTEKRRTSEESKAKKIKNWEKKLEKDLAQLEKYEKMTTEEYLEYKNIQHSDYAWKGLKFWGLKFLMFLLFVFFSFIPEYELDRRGGRDVEVSGFMSFIGRLFDSLITMQPRIITSDDGYGHKTTSSDDSGSLLAFFLPIVIMAIVVMIIVFYFLPFMLLFAFIRNFLIPKLH